MGSGEFWVLGFVCVFCFVGGGFVCFCFGLLGVLVIESFVGLFFLLCLFFLCLLGGVGS